jgi:hypothetical protein
LAKALVEQRRPWVILRSTDTSKLVTAATTWQTAIDLSTITRFNRFYGLLAPRSVVAACSANLANSDFRPNVSVEVAGPASNDVVGTGLTVVLVANRTGGAADRAPVRDVEEWIWVALNAVSQITRWIRGTSVT